FFFFFFFQAEDGIRDRTVTGVQTCALPISAVIQDIEKAARAVDFTISSDIYTGSLLRTLAAAKPGGTLLELGTGCGMGTAWILRSEERRVGKECRGGWGGEECA